MNRKNKWLATLSAGLLMAVMTTLVMWLLGDNKSFEQALVIGAIGGLIAAPIFMWVMTKAAKNITEQTAVVLTNSLDDSKENTDGDSTETVLRQTNATHFHKFEGVGGTLILTPNRLIFQSHGMNIQNHQWEVNLSNIQRFKRRKTLGLIPNGLEVLIEGNEKADRFVVIGAKDWYEALEKNIH